MKSFLGQAAKYGYVPAVEPMSEEEAQSLHVKILGYGGNLMQFVRAVEARGAVNRSQSMKA